LFYPYSIFEELRKLSKDASVQPTLGPAHYELLLHFAQHPNTSAYELSPIRQGIQNEKDYSNTKNRIRRLHGMKLIEKFDNNLNKHNANYYKLSVYGLYYLIAKGEALSHTLMRVILKNYGDHPLFSFFLYPYVGQNSLLAIFDSHIFSAIFSYLHELCKKLQKTADTWDRTKVILDPDRNKIEFIVIDDISEFLKSEKPFNNTPMSLKELKLAIFRYHCQTSAFELIHSIISVYTGRSSAVNILTKDERFMQALEMTKEHFGNMYKLFMNTKST
jgi:hypothetical protein